jgi:hypothetical protein
VTVVKVGKDEKEFDGNVSINNLRSVATTALYTAATGVSEILRHAGVRHTIGGGVAVCCNGYGRTTQNVDYVVGKCAFEYRDKALFLRPELPVRYLGIPIHYVAPSNPFEQAMLDQYLTVPAHGVVPVLPLNPLIVMKLIAHRHKDRADIVELLKRCAGPTVESALAFVAENLPSQKDVFEGLVADAEAETVAEGGV